MVFKPEPLTRAIQAAKAAASPSAKVIYVSPMGRQFNTHWRVNTPKLRNP